MLLQPNLRPRFAVAFGDRQQKSTSFPCRRLTLPGLQKHSYRPVHCRIAQLDRPEVLEASVGETRLAWYQRPCEGFQTLSNADELEAVLANASSYVAIEIMAGSCNACKASFPKLCSIPQDERLRRQITFYKCNIAEDESLFRWIKSHGVRSLPHLAVFNSQGKHVAGLVSTLKRMAQVKQSLHTILDNPHCDRFGVDAQGDLQPSE